MAKKKPPASNKVAPKKRTKKEATMKERPKAAKAWQEVLGRKL